MANTALPALRQSAYETMSCPHSYALVHIDGLRPPDTTQSFRGTEIHEVMGAYVSHCAQRRVAADFAYFDTLMLDTGEEATTILQGCRENTVVDWQNFFAAEMPLGLDEDFKPTWSIMHDNSVLPPDPLWNIKGDLKPTAYTGILDAIYLMAGGTVARIEDYKSHPRPFDPTTFQGRLYSLMLFMFMPELEEVEFVLRFVRYSNIARPIKFHREQVPELKAEVKRERARQAEYHQTYKEEGIEALPAFAGTHCQYCPALSNFKCPIAQLNPIMQLTPAERLNFRLWYSVVSRANNQAMSQIVEGSGGTAIHAADANGKMYTFGPVESEKTTYPLFVWTGNGFEMPVVEAIQNWLDTTPEDWMPSKRSPLPWPANIRISSTKLNSYLKAKKREIVHNAVKDVAVKESTVTFKVTRDAEVDDGRGEEHQQFSHDDPQGENVGCSTSAPAYEF